MITSEWQGAGYLDQHRRDSEELRRLCADRDAIKAERDTLRAQIEAAEADRDSWMQAADDRIEDWRAMRRRAEAAEAEAARLRHAGAMLATCAFNLAQRDHLKDEERRSLDLCRIAWDAARTKEETK